MRSLRPTRRRFLRGMLGAAGVGAFTSRCAESASASAPRPNFVFLLCDDLGYGDVGCYGHPVIRTPYLDAMAAQGIRFTDCYAAAPVCSPARAGIITGRNPYRAGVADWIPENSPVHLRRSEASVAALLRSAGYRTGHCGKWHLSGTLDGSQPTPGDHGFDSWFATQNNAAPNHHHPTNFVRNGAAAGRIEGYSSAIIVDECLRFLDGASGGPFALFVWFHSPHEPIATAPAFEAMYADEPNLTKRAYYGNVSQIDHEAGRLLAELDARGLRDDTLVMFTSDNGPETLNRYRGAERSHGSPGPLRGMKLHLYEGGVRVPGIALWPGVAPAETVCGAPVSGADVLPTLCALAGAALPEGLKLDGMDIAPLIQGESVPRAQPLYWRYDRAISGPKAAIRDGDWKLLVDGERNEWELYHLRDDPGETVNLAASQPAILASMRAKLEEIHASVEKDYVQARF